MKVLIIGMGSIAAKHIDALRKLEDKIEIYALRSSTQAKDVVNVRNIYSYGEIEADTDFILISNPTSEHAATISALIPSRIPLFIEKPPVAHLSEADNTIRLITNYESRTYVAFNLRFHPALQYLNKHLSSKRLLEANVYCGSYLPDWRPGKDYRKIYSADRAQGGGVHLDLIHEIDYSIWLFGKPDKTRSLHTRISDLEINSVDYANYSFLYPDKVVNILLNYFRRDPKRNIELVFENETWNVNLLTSEIVNQDGKAIFNAKFDILDTYRNQMAYFIETLKNGTSFHPNFSEAVEALKICNPDD